MVRIVSKKERESWIEKNKSNLAINLTPSLKFILFVLYNNKELKNLNKKAIFLKVTYSWFLSKMYLLRDLGLIKIIKKGRVNTYRITQGGEKFCEDLLKKLI